MNLTGWYSPLNKNLPIWQNRTSIKLQTVNKVWGFLCISPAQKYRYLKSYPTPFIEEVLSIWTSCFDRVKYLICQKVRGYISDVYHALNFTITPNAPHQLVGKMKRCTWSPFPLPMSFMCKSPIWQRQIIYDLLHDYTFAREWKVLCVKLSFCP